VGHDTLSPIFTNWTDVDVMRYFVQFVVVMRREQNVLPVHSRTTWCGVDVRRSARLRPRNDPPIRALGLVVAMGWPTRTLIDLFVYGR
jgi:hypothetical protein